MSLRCYSNPTGLFRLMHQVVGPRMRHEMDYHCQAVAQTWSHGLVQLKNHQTEPKTGYRPQPEIPVGALKPHVRTKAAMLPTIPERLVSLAAKVCLAEAGLVRHVQAS